MQTSVGQVGPGGGTLLTPWGEAPGEASPVVTLALGFQVLDCGQQTSVTEVARPVVPWAGPWHTHVHGGRGFSEPRRHTFISQTIWMQY